MKRLFGRSPSLNDRLATATAAVSSARDRWKQDMARLQRDLQDVTSSSDTLRTAFDELIDAAIAAAKEGKR